MLFTPQIEAAIAHLKATHCKPTLTMEEKGEIAFKLVNYKIVLRARSAPQPDTIRIELTPEKHLTIRLDDNRITLLDTSIQPDIIRDGLEMRLPPSKLVALFHLHDVNEAWHGRNRSTDTPIGDVVDILVSAAYARQAA